MATPTINDLLPEPILSNIIASVSDVRSRNSVALVCKRWRLLERATRTTLTLRGNIRDLYFFMVPTCFRSVIHLDLSLISPWGHSLTTSSAASLTDPAIIAQYLLLAFPAVTSLTLYARDISTLQLLARLWPDLKQVKLVRWHQRPQLATAGEELNNLFQQCRSLCSLDLSSFYCWTDDVLLALQSNPLVSSNLTCLNLSNPSFSEGFKSDEIKEISKACPNLKEFRAVCMFDPRYIELVVGDEALVSIATNCPKLTILHLADTNALSNLRGDPENEGFTQEDARISVPTLIEVFSGLPLLEELVLDVCNNVRDSGPAFEGLNSKCPKLRHLKLGQFHGISMPVESTLDGIALCERLESLSIRNVGDLNDMGLIAIARGCCRLAKFEIQGCKKITMKGMRTFVHLLQRTLVEVKISCCKNLGASSSLKALEPIQSRIQRLHIDCVWDCNEEDLNKLDQGKMLNQSFGHTNYLRNDDCEYGGNSKRRKYLDDPNCSYASMDVNDNVYYKRGKNLYDLNCSYGEMDVNNNGYDNGNGFGEKTWDRLQSLSLWITVGQLLTPLVSAGLENCPNLEETRIKVEGDCREMSKPSERDFGLSILGNYQNLSKMHLDCGEITGYSQTAPSGQLDLSLWERFYLFGIGGLSLMELDYWLPQDRDVNHRSLSLPAAGLLQECYTLRKLFIHGTANEHFIMFLPRIPGLRDVQLREDYYPAPESDTSTEMRADSCCRFEAALNRRQVPD
ncbi:F-box/LRR-repeat MAX2 homolog A-like [Olea europaea var. sylvestris]|uniref:F-box/LRR-repeat MAX2 homolog A-like n=1 Tax=Olea europaea var. sylvestris TaxID=158386 RepID=UPI000C1D3EC3|nr:F-box/LRR-repeat MAX2 homolog A-like [Olea europaea var. sylvestris]